MRPGTGTPAAGSATGRRTTVGELAAAEPLAALPLVPFPRSSEDIRVVSAQALAPWHGNFYSVPPGHAGQQVTVRHQVGKVMLDVVTAAGTVLARHRRERDHAARSSATLAMWPRWRTRRWRPAATDRVAAPPQGTPSPVGGGAAEAAPLRGEQAPGADGHRFRRLGCGNPAAGAGRAARRSGPGRVLQPAGGAGQRTCPGLAACLEAKRSESKRNFRRVLMTTTTATPADAAPG